MNIKKITFLSFYAGFGNINVYCYFPENCPEILVFQ